MNVSKTIETKREIDLILVKASIVHFQYLDRITQATGDLEAVSYDLDKSPLCEKYLTFSSLECTGCPVVEYTGRYNCKNTPMDEEWTNDLPGNMSHFLMRIQEFIENKPSL